MLNIHHIRNATMVIETDNDVILVDPMLGPKGSLPSFTLFRHKPRKNPTVEMPDNCQPLLDKVTHCLITHRHPDHIDTEGERFLREHKIPITCSFKDEKALKKKGLNIAQTLKYWDETSFLGGKIIGTPARHGYGFVAKPMGNVMGFYIDLPDEPSIYLSSDTIYTKEVKKVLQQHKPAISVLAAGAAQFDIFQPLIMKMKDMLMFIKDAPGKVIANHLEAINHCPTTREQLRNEVKKLDLPDKVFIPEDGEKMVFN